MQDLYHPLHWLCSKHTKSQVGCYAIGTTVEQLGSFFLLYIYTYIYIYMYICTPKLRSYGVCEQCDSSNPGGPKRCRDSRFQLDSPRA